MKINSRYAMLQPLLPSTRINTIAPPGPPLMHVHEVFSSSTSFLFRYLITSFQSASLPNFLLLSFPSQPPVRGWHCAQSTSCCISLPPHIPNLIQRPPVPFPPCPCPSLAGPYPILNTKLTTTATPTKSASTLGPNLSSKPPCPLNLILLALQWYVTSA